MACRLEQYQRKQGICKVSESQIQVKSSSTSSLKTAWIWSGVSIGLIGTGIGLHLMADHQWDQRQIGNQQANKDLQSHSTTLSWIGDGTLIGGMIAGIVAGTYFLKPSKSTRQSSSSQKVSTLVPIISPDLSGGMWVISF